MKPARTVHRARQLRKDMSLPERLLWRILKTSPNDLKFRRQHPAGPYVLDFFCARANLAIEIDGFAHDIADQPKRDAARDAWLAAHKIDCLRIPAHDVLRNAEDAASALSSLIEHRLTIMGKTAPTSLRDATSPCRNNGEEN